jgi:hypothetical protein
MVFAKFDFSGADVGMTHRGLNLVAMLWLLWRRG